MTRSADERPPPADGSRRVATTRRTLLAGLAAGALPGIALAAAPSVPATPALAATGPGTGAGPVTLVTGAAEGSPADQWVRAFAPFLERHLPRRPVAVANRPGLDGLAALGDLAGGTIRTGGASNAGGTALGHALTPDLLARIVERDAAALLGRLRFLAAVSEEPLVLAIPPDTDLAALRRPGPAGVLALPPAGSAAALAAPALLGALNLVPLHFPSAAAARQAALAGNVAAALVRTCDAAASLRDGRLLALGIAASGRCPLFPEVPTLAELGIALVASARRGFVLPASTPAAEARTLADALRAAVADPEYVAQAEALGTLPRFGDEADWTARVRRDLAVLGQRWRAEPWLTAAR